MTWHTPTTEDALRKAAIDLATDVASLMVSEKEQVRAEHAYVLAMECVRIADRIQKARLAALPHEAREQFEEARTATVRAIIGLDRAGAHGPLPKAATDGIHSRLSELALALGALSREAAD
jgi:hypothetical protein